MTFYVRPHQFEVTRSSKGLHSFKAKVKYINPTGAVAKLELVAERGDLVQVEIAQADYQEVFLKKEDEVYLTSKEIRVGGKENADFDPVDFVESGGGI